jgi:hypothetical protein
MNRKMIGEAIFLVMVHFSVVRFGYGMKRHVLMM